MSKPLFNVGEVQVRAVMPATLPGWKVLRLVWSGDVVTGFTEMPVVGWAVDDLGMALPMTPHAADHLASVMCPNGTVADPDETTHENVEIWFAAAKLEAEAERLKLKARRIVRTASFKAAAAAA